MGVGDGALLTVTPPPICPDLFHRLLHEPSPLFWPRGGHGPVQSLPLGECGEHAAAPWTEGPRVTGLSRHCRPRTWGLPVEGRAEGAARLGVGRVKASVGLRWDLCSSVRILSVHLCMCPLTMGAVFLGQFPGTVSPYVSRAPKSGAAQLCTPGRCVGGCLLTGEPVSPSSACLPGGSVSVIHSLVTQDWPTGPVPRGGKPSFPLETCMSASSLPTGLCSGEGDLVPKAWLTHPCLHRSSG